MPKERQYVEIPLKYSWYERNAHLRNYAYDMQTGKRTVLDSEKIGAPIKPDEKLRIIYPLVESEDKKWVQAMGPDGTCGYIRKSRVDEQQLEQEKAKGKLKTLPDYQYRVDMSKIEDPKEWQDMEMLAKKVAPVSWYQNTLVLETPMSRTDLLGRGMSAIPAYSAKKKNEEIYGNSLKQKYDEDLATYGNRFFAEEMCRERIAFKDKAFDQMTVGCDEIKSDAAPADRMMIVAESSHGSEETRKWMAGQIQSGALSDIDTLYVEDFMDRADQPVLDKYFAKKDAPMPGMLDSFCKLSNHKGFQELLEAARDKGIKVVALGSGLAQTDTRTHLEERAAKFNLAAAETIAQNPPAAGKRGLIYAGAAHVFCHPGMEEGKVIKGFCQIFDQPAEMMMNGIMTNQKKDLVKAQTGVGYITPDAYRQSQLAGKAEKGTQEIGFSQLQQEVQETVKPAQKAAKTAPKPQKESLEHSSEEVKKHQDKARAK